LASDFVDPRWGEKMKLRREGGSIEVQRGRERGGDIYIEVEEKVLWRGER